MELKDWFVVILVAAVWIAATIFVFLHPDSVNFATWATVTSVMTGFYHYMMVRDSKVPDAT